MMDDVVYTSPADGTTSGVLTIRVTVGLLLAFFFFLPVLVLSPVHAILLQEWTICIAISVYTQMILLYVTYPTGRAGGGSSVVK